MNAPFTARLAPTFESQPADERLYEVVTQEGERIASATDKGVCEVLAHNLNRQCYLWAGSNGQDAVLG